MDIQQIAAAAHAKIVEWEDCEGGVIGYNVAGDAVVEVDALQDRAKCNKWGESYRPGRGWSVTLEDGTIRRGHSDNLRAAKKAALARLAQVTPADIRAMRFARR